MDAEPQLVATAATERPERMAWSPRGAAVALGVSVPSVYALINSGQLRSVKVGARRLISVAAIKAFLGDTDASEPAS